MISASSFAQTNGSTVWGGNSGESPKTFPCSSPWQSLEIPKNKLGDLSKVKSLHLSYQERGKTFYETPDQNGGFPIYYKPEGTNRCGDPMPFYDTKTNKYKVLYLYETTSNGTFFHPLYGVETSDAFSYTNLGEVRPVGNGTAGSKDASIGTGSCVIGSDGKYHLFYTRHDNQRSTYDEVNPKECIMHVSSSTFEGLKTETPTIIIKPDENNYSRYDFRDPEVFWCDEDNLWHMVVSTKINQGKTNEKGVIAEYTSADLSTWTHKGVFIKCMWDRFYECPNVFKMGDYWYLVYSELTAGLRRVQYFKANTLDGLRNITGNATSDDDISNASPDDKEGILTSRGLYAGKTASNGSERIMWGWSSYPKAPKDCADMHEWAGALVAHKLQQDAAGRLTLVEPTSFASSFNETKTIEAKERDRDHILYGRLGYHTRTTFTVTVPDKRGWNGEDGNSQRDWARNFSLCFARGDGHSWYELMFECNGDGTKRSIKMYRKWHNGQYIDGQYIDGQHSYEFTQPASVAAPSTYEKNYPLINYHITMITDNSVLTLYVKDDDENTLCTYTCRIPNLARNCWGLGLYGTNSEDGGDYNDTRITNITYKEYNSADNASDCILNVLTAWNNENKVLARQNTANTKMYGSYATIDLNGIDLEEKFDGCENLIIQIHPELGGDLVLTSVSINDNTPLWEGWSYIDWLPEEGNITVKIPASEFLKRDLRIGQRITVDVEKGSFMPADYIELHDGTQILPGSRYKHWITENQTITIYVTHGMFAHLLNNGLEVCGRDFYLKKVCLLDRLEADNIKASSIWSNYFWSYNKQDFDHASGTWIGGDGGYATMDVPCEAFETIVGTKEQLNTARLADYKAMRFYYEHGDDNAFEVLTGFGSGESLGSTNTYGTYKRKNSDNTYTEYKYAELPLTEDGVKLLKKACEKTRPNNRFFVRFNNGDTGKKYNFTDITLVPGAMTLQPDAVATFSSVESVKVEGLQAYTVKQGNSENEVVCVLIEDGIVPAGTGVLLYNNTESAVRGTFVTTDEAADHDFTGNLLHATSRADHNLEPVPSEKVYCLYGGTKKFGPYQSTSFQSNKCFLMLPAQVSPAKQITLNFPSDIVTDIAVRQAENCSTSTAIYNIAGQRVNGSYKGVIIKNNKKYILK